jgi:hypothetical protein
VWTNPPLQALLQQREGSGGGLGYGSGAFDVIRWVVIGSMTMMVLIQSIQPIVVISGSIR